MSQHDYQPGTTSSPMHTDPACADCGEPKTSYLHSTAQLSSAQRRAFRAAVAQRPTADAVAIAKELRHLGWKASASTSVVPRSGYVGLHVHQSTSDPDASVRVTLHEPLYSRAKRIQAELESLGHGSDVLPDGSGLFVRRGQLTSPTIHRTTFLVVCDDCGDQHPAEYSHEGRFGEGPVFAVVCTVDQLTGYYTTEALVGR